MGRCFIVGVGASEGGQRALEQLFAAMPADCDLSFVVIMHLPPDGPTVLAEILRRFTPMEVVTATEGMLLQPNRVHVMPPGSELTVSDGRLHLEKVRKRESPHPIDRFLAALAADAAVRAMAVILSGSGSDGTTGVKKIKEAGGSVLVQSPKEAGNPAMPQSAIAGGAADLVQPVAEMPGKIASLARQSCRLPPQTCLPRSFDEDLQIVFTLVKDHTGHDFSSYKRNTVMRRLERRMTVNEVSGIGKYIALLQENEREARALCQEILIGVTSFFRDPEAFESLRRDVLPRLLNNREPDDPVRIWHACCATGEEVYSMAILIREFQEAQGQDVPVRFFATDIDEISIAQARSGQYPPDIETEIGEDRLAKYFTRTDSGYQVVKELREMVVFAHHSLIKDPPFSRLDLLVCRNFLIYLNPDLQKRLIGLFHQVLKPGGILFLGGAETVGRFSDLFSSLDKRWKIYARREGGRRSDAFFTFAAPVRRMSGTGAFPRPGGGTEPSPGEMAEKLLKERYLPPCVVVNEKYEVIHVSARMKRFLEVPAGEPTRDVLKMAREGLRPALRAGIYRAFGEDKTVEFRGVTLAEDGGEKAVNVLVEPVNVGKSVGRLAVVVFEPVASPAEVSASPAGGEAAFAGDETSKDRLIHHLEEQLRITHEQLQMTTEQLESSNEGFMSTNEELLSINEEYQSANEELQSTNEELETSKEELQALNEELVTVNAELQGKVEELNRANADMENLLHSSKIATVFLDRQLTIQRFTPAAAAIFNLIPADLGRPFRHLAGAIDWPSLTQDAEKVLAGQSFAEREVRELEGGRIFLKRVFPYRSVEGRIDGLVVIFIDITERKGAQETIREAAEQRLLALEAAELGSWDYRLDTGEAFWDERFREIFGLTAEAPATLDAAVACMHPQDRAAVEEAIQQALAGVEGGGYKTEYRVVQSDGSVNWVTSQGRVHFSGEDENRRAVRFVGVNRDITERKQAEETLHRYELLAENTRDIILFIRCEDGRILEANAAALQAYGYARDEMLSLTVRDLRDAGARELTAAQMAAADEEGILFETVHRHREGGSFPVEVSSRGATVEGQRILFSVIRDITARKQAEEALLLAKEAAEAATQAKSRFLANMSHELRTPMTGVLGMLELVLGRSLDPGQREFIDMAHQSARSLLRILNDILDLTKIEAGKLTLEEKPFSLRECVAGSVDILYPEAKRKGIALTYRLADELPERMVGDQVRLRQVLTNLVGNAVKFTEHGSVEVRVAAGDKVSESRREIVFTVSDTGIGIPEEKQLLLFQAFTQVDDSNTRRHGGTGLGLAISKEIVERMGGTISLASREGEGSTFSFSVPLGIVDSGKGMDLSSAATCRSLGAGGREPSPGEARPRLLVAEDDRLIRKILEIMLRKFGYDFDIAEDGRQAVRMWEEGDYHLVFMDVQMPILDGFEATRAIREKERQSGGYTPIVAMTAHALKEDQERCLAAGMDGYLSKPIDFSKCRAMIEEMLQGMTGLQQADSGAEA